jgi:hypothetical protein
MSNESRARALVDKAEKKLASWSLFSSGSKYEDASEMYAKAANMFKVSKCCECDRLRHSVPRRPASCQTRCSSETGSMLTSTAVMSVQGTTQACALRRRQAAI